MWNTVGLVGSETILHETLIVSTCPCTFVKTCRMCKTKSERSRRLCSLGDTGMPTRLTGCNKRPSLVSGGGGDVESQGSRAWGGGI